jgi:hypothetical protein
MENRILCYSDSGKRNDFIKSVNEMMQSANKLIQTYNSYQDFTKVTTLEDFETLHADPLGVFDKTIIEGCAIKSTSGKVPDPSVLSSLFKIDRAGYMAAIGQSEPIKEDDCPGCQKKAHSVRLKNIRSNAEYNVYSGYLFFIGGLFQLNNKAINDHCDTFNVYAESPEQIALYNHWQSVCDILNAHNNKYPMGSASRDQVSKALKLQQLNDKFIINQMALSEQIKYNRL